MSDNPNQNAASPMDILLDIELPVTLRFGRRQMSLEDILRLDTGSIIEFDRAVEMMKSQAIAQRLYDERANSGRTTAAAVKAAQQP